MAFPGIRYTQDTMRESRVCAQVFIILGVLFCSNGEDEVNLSAELKAALADVKKENRFMSMGCWGGDKSAKKRQHQVGKLMGTLADTLDMSYTIAAGDNFYKHGVSSVTDAQWQSTFLAPYPPSLPFYAALGNHDYKGNIWAQVNYTSLPSNVLPTPVFNHDKHWNLPYPYYSKLVGNVFLIVIDTVLFERCEVNKNKPDLFKKRCWDGYAQLDWLKKELTENVPAETWHIVVVGHYPLYANGPHLNQQWMQNILTPLFEAHGVSAYINADNHYMQYSVVNGVHYINSGGGAGYMMHTPHQKGYKEHSKSVWSYISDGVFAHFALRDTLLNFVAEPGRGVVHEFRIPTRLKPKAQGANAQATEIVSKVTKAEVVSVSHNIDPLPANTAYESNVWSASLLLYVAGTMLILGVLGKPLRSVLCNARRSF